MNNSTGIRQRILNATSESAVNGLLLELEGYNMVSPKTYRAAVRAGAAQKAFLKHQELVRKSAPKAAPSAPPQATGPNSKDRRKAKRAALKS